MTGANVTPITGKGRVAKIAPTTDTEAAEAVTAGTGTIKRSHLA